MNLLHFRGLPVFHSARLAPVLEATHPTTAIVSRILSKNPPNILGDKFIGRDYSVATEKPLHTFVFSDLF
ncbi:hypothetical protein PHSC3_002027 [Chlamydiales bacterium STE3]|nr:hypothetical protein PHSC3_002027 [Chlamydiales bacterium STE3]